MDEPVAPQADAVLEPAGALSSDPRAMTDLLQFEERPFTAVMAREAGISRGMLQRLKASGQVRSPLRHVYVAAAAPDSLDLRARAAALVLPPHVVVADRAAAWLHGVDVLDFAELDPHAEVVGRRDPQELPGRADGAQGVILAAPVDPEDGHDRVADVGFDNAAVLLQDPAGQREVAPQRLVAGVRRGDPLRSHRPGEKLELTVLRGGGSASPEKVRSRSTVVDAANCAAPSFSIT